MGLIKRIEKLLESNVNALINKFENPEKMIDQALRDLNESLAQIRQETTTVIDEEGRCKDTMDKLKAEVDEWDKRARKAIKKGKENDARVFIAKKQKTEARYVDAVTVYEAARDNADKMLCMHDSVVAQIKDKEEQRESLRAVSCVTKSQERINEMLSSIDIGAGVATFDYYKEKINSGLRKAEAMTELLQAPTDKAVVLAKEYDSDEFNVSVEEELNALKKEMLA